MGLSSKLFEPVTASILCQHACSVGMMCANMFIPCLFWLCRPQLIRVCSEHGQAVTALSVYEWMKAPASVGGAGLGPTVYTYTAAMRAALAAGLLDRALQVWEDAQAAKCPLDCRLCITYIEVSCCAVWWSMTSLTGLAGCGRNGGLG